MLWAHFVCLETVVLDRVELFANSTGMLLTDITSPLKVCAVCLGTLRLASVQQRFDTVLEQSVLVIDLVVAIAFDTLELAQ